MDRSVTVGSGEFELIDLSVEVSEDHPCWWPGTVSFRASTFVDFEPWAWPCFMRSLTMDEHTGTHFDAPRHFLHDSPIYTDQVPLETFIGPMRVIDVPGADARPGQSPLFGASVLAAHEELAGTVPAGAVVVFRTGWSEERYRPWPEGRSYLADTAAGRTPGWPAPEPPLLEELADRGVKVIGTDSPSIGAAHDPAPAHVASLGRGVMVIEQLTNLSRVPLLGATFLFLPLRIVGGSGSPGRAVALVPGRPLAAGEEEDSLTLVPPPLGRLRGPGAPPD
jgi:kynurenine formamidase